MAKRIKHYDNSINVTKLIQDDNTLDQFVTNFVEGYISENLKNNGFTEMQLESLNSYLANPEKYYEQLSNLIKYERISNGAIFQLHSLLSSLPSLNYKLNCFDITKKNLDKDTNLINTNLQKVEFKKTTRDLIDQGNTDGTVVTLWCGNNKDDLYLHVFSNLKYVFPAYRRKGRWVNFIDLAWLDTMKDIEREHIYEELHPFVTKKDYENYKNDSLTYQYKELPQDRSHAIRFNTMNRNQRLGIPTGTQSLKDILHKETLKKLETAIADKIINSIPVLTIGNKDKPNESINKNLRKSIGQSVMRVLQSSSTGKIGMITLPEYAELKWERADGLDALDDTKYVTINKDITSSTGIGDALTNGEGNGSTAKYNLDMIYKRIGVMLEEIELVWNQYIKLILPQNSKKNYMFEFDKETPLSKKEQIEILSKLHSEGFSVKSLIDMLNGIDYKAYIDQSILEQNSGMYDIITPPLSSYTMTGKDAESDTKAGHPVNKDPDSEETLISQDKNGGVE